MATTAYVLVQVIAVGGKFIGDDIGGAAITIRDADTNEMLAQGVTRGNSGPNASSTTPQGVMDQCVKRGQTIISPTGTSSFTAEIALNSPRRVQVSAFGPLGARGSANTTSTTTWLYPSIVASNGILLEIPGLICQVINPPTHTTFPSSPATLNIVTNIAMMCGCPISIKAQNEIVPGPANVQPWLPDDFEVIASIVPFNNTGKVDPIVVPLSWDTSSKMAGRFVRTLNGIPANTYQMTVIAQQKSTGNTGIDLSAFTVKGS